MGQPSESSPVSRLISQWVDNIGSVRDFGEHEQSGLLIERNEEV